MAPPKSYKASVSGRPCDQEPRLTPSGISGLSPGAGVQVDRAEVDGWDGQVDGEVQTRAGGVRVVIRVGRIG